MSFSEKLIEIYKPLKNRALFHCNYNNGFAEDLLHDTLERCLEQKEKFDGQNLFGWALKIMKNTFIDGKRRKKTYSKVIGKVGHLYSEKPEHFSEEKTPDMEDYSGIDGDSSNISSLPSSGVNKGVNYKSSLTEEEIWLDFKECLKKLTDDQQEVFQLQMGFKKTSSSKPMTAEGISSLLDIPTNTVLSWLAKAKKDLGECLELNGAA